MGIWILGYLLLALFGRWYSLTEGNPSPSLGLGGWGGVGGVGVGRGGGGLWALMVSPLFQTALSVWSFLLETWSLGFLFWLPCHASSFVMDSHSGTISPNSKPFLVSFPFQGHSNKNTPRTKIKKSIKLWILLETHKKKRILLVFHFQATDSLFSVRGTRDKREMIRESDVLCG